MSEDEDKIKLKAQEYEYLGAAMLTTALNQDTISGPMAALTLRNSNTFRTRTVAISKEHARKLHADLLVMLARPDFK
jgi:hypothetical protein